MVGNNVVAFIRYPNCTNFEGNKVLVFKNYTLAKLYSRTRLDPHFSEDASCHAPFARFEPTGDGLAAAYILAELI